MFYIRSNTRISAAGSTVTDLADSTLYDIAKDSSDSRQHLAEKELERRHTQSSDSLNKQQNKLLVDPINKAKANDHNGLLNNVEKYLDTNKQDIAVALKEAIKYGF